MPQDLRDGVSIAAIEPAGLAGLPIPSESFVSAPARAAPLCFVGCSAGSSKYVQAGSGCPRDTPRTEYDRLGYGPVPDEFKPFRHRPVGRLFVAECDRSKRDSKFVRSLEGQLQNYRLPDPEGDRRHDERAEVPDC